jgi:effector-binding domain-containing protein
MNLNHSLYRLKKSVKVKGKNINGYYCVQPMKDNNLTKEENIVIDKYNKFKRKIFLNS